MRLNRFIGEYDLSKQGVEITSPEIVQQIKNVLKLKVGEKIIIGDGESREAEVVLTSINPKKITGIIEKIKRIKENVRKVTLYLAILKKDNFELAVQKAVEAGISHIVPMITERTIKTGINVARLRKIILEASEQSNRHAVPTLSNILNFEDALEAGIRSEERTIFHFVEEEYIPTKENKSTAIFIGPEGGFTENEINLAKEKGYAIASLGEFVLRGETAAIIATYRAVQAI